MLSSLLLILFHRFEELTNSIKQLKNHKKIKDISKVLTGWFANLLYISYYHPSLYSSVTIYVKVHVVLYLEILCSTMLLGAVACLMGSMLNPEVSNMQYVFVLSSQGKALTVLSHYLAGVKMWDTPDL